MIEATSQAPVKAKPVFVISSFRTSSTWLWDKLRRLPDCVAYYEFFHDFLQNFDGKAASGLHYSIDNWTSKHPPSAPYFLEFLPLCRDGGGISGYEESMAFDRFIPSAGIDGDLSEAEQLYIGRLISHAQSLTKTPILTCTRALGRTRAIKNKIDCKVILLCRNLFHQWGSYSFQFAIGNPYFIQTINKTIFKSKHDPFINHLDNWFSDRLEDPSDQSMFQAFVLMHLYFYAKAYDAADVVIDVSAAAQESQLMSQAEDDIFSILGTTVDLSDIRSNFEFSSLIIKSFAAFEDSINQFTKIIVGDSGLSTAAKTFVNKIKADTLIELERHEFYVRGRRAIECQRVTALNQSVTAELNHLGVSLAAAKQQLIEPLPSDS